MDYNFRNQFGVVLYADNYFESTKCCHDLIEIDVLINH